MNKTLMKIIEKIDWEKNSPDAITLPSGKVFPVKHGTDERGKYIDISTDEFPEEFKVVLVGGQTGVVGHYRYYTRVF
jgi:hypothetical protein